MKPQADATTEYWVTAVPCPWCLAFAGDLPHTSRHKVMRLGEQFGFPLGSWLRGPGRARGHPNICGQTPRGVPRRSGELRGGGRSELSQCPRLLGIWGNGKRPPKDHARHPHQLPTGSQDCRELVKIARHNFVTAKVTNADNSRQIKPAR